MEKVKFVSLLNEIIDGIKMNKNTIDKAIKEEMSRGDNNKVEKIISIIESYKNISIPSVPENQKVAVCYSGKSEITITYMLDSILYNNRVLLCVNGNKSINEILFKIFSESLMTLKIINQWIDYNSNYNEIFLRDNQDKFERFIYIGDYFEYERFKNFFNRDVEYRNYGTIKLFVDRAKFGEELKKITKYSYDENFSLEVFDDIDDFINESRKEDFAVVFADFNIINRLQKELRAEEVLVNTFPYDNYKFEVVR